MTTTERPTKKRIELEDGGHVEIGRMRGWDAWANVKRLLTSVLGGKVAGHVQDALAGPIGQRITDFLTRSAIAVDPDKPLAAQIAAAKNSGWNADDWRAVLPDVFARSGQIVPSLIEQVIELTDCQEALIAACVREVYFKPDGGDAITEWLRIKHRLTVTDWLECRNACLEVNDLEKLASLEKNWLAPLVKTGLKMWLAFSGKSRLQSDSESVGHTTSLEPTDGLPSNRTE